MTKTVSNAVCLNAILDTLMVSPLVPSMRLFGSAITDKPLPADIDVLIDLQRTLLPREQLTAALREILELAFRGGYHGNYGYFDPFVWTKTRKLYTRDELEPRWVRAKQQTQNEMLRAAKNGVPLLAFTKRYTTSRDNT